MEAKDCVVVILMLLSVGLFNGTLTYCVWNKQLELANELQRKLKSNLQSELQNELKNVFQVALNNRVHFQTSEPSQVKGLLKRDVRQADGETDTLSATEILTNALTEIIELKLTSYMDCNRNEYNFTQCTLKPGPKGEPGDTGPPGVQGRSGEKGDMGDRGQPGGRGMIGYPGYKGEKGKEGVEGPEGPPGPQGPAGTQGKDGRKGEQGLAGPKGSTGLTGQKGTTGEKGAKGDIGERGLKGDIGPPGLRGGTGDKGDMGQRGEPGSKGMKGIVGYPGYKGEKGLQGKVGPQGPPGPIGPRGPPGLSSTVAPTTVTPTTVPTTVAPTTVTPTTAPTTVTPTTAPTTDAPTTVSTTSTTLPRQSCGGSPGWTRVVLLNMTDPRHVCPTGLSLTSYSRRTCGRATSNMYNRCWSTTFSVGGSQYNRVCGRARAYREGQNWAFWGYHAVSQGIDSSYVDGLSLTHGAPLSRQHIWTFASGISTDNRYSGLQQCPCDNGNRSLSPPFVGNDYFCESVTAAGAFTFYPNAPLWDDQACEGGGRCCLLNNPPWFTKNLTNTTTDGIELRLCMNTISGDIALELLELYIQ